ncbi:CRAL/TRIO domain [Nesidiocoris tenuis]|uniref:CRAL/TRIO domain n=1 Tax=Nesidiocoris tenuis TaxID=355587 RepID=A0ABN7BA80_9HEMI|nr:CRAL/TRIO domain [Nesidiocoris tenuis]
MDANTNWEPANEDMETLKDWVTKQPHLPKDIPDEMLSLFLFSCFSKMETTKKAVDTYYSMKTATPEFFANRDLDCKGLQHIIKVVQIVVLPEKTAEGYAVVWSRLIDTDTSKFVLDDGIKLLFMVVDTILRNEHTDAKGLLFVFDNTGTTLGHLARVSLSSVKKYFIYVQEAMPIRLRGVNIININTVITHIMTLIKPFIGKEQAKQIVMYTPEQLEQSYKAIPKHMHPKDYGGDGPSMETLFRDTMKKIRAQKDWFEYDSTMRIDLAKKTTKTSGMEGSFKKLSFD